MLKRMMDTAEELNALGFRLLEMGANEVFDTTPDGVRLHPEELKRRLTEKTKAMVKKEFWPRGRIAIDFDVATKRSDVLSNYYNWVKVWLIDNLYVLANDTADSIVDPISMMLEHCHEQEDDYRSIAESYIFNLIKHIYLWADDKSSQNLMVKIREDGDRMGFIVMMQGISDDADIEEFTEALREWIGDIFEEATSTFEFGKSRPEPKVYFLKGE